MAQIRFANNVSTQLTKSVTADDSTIEVRSLTDGLVWPNISATGDYFLIVIDDISSSTWEIMKCTKVQVNGSTTILTVERGLEGTTPSAFNAGSVVENRLTAGTLDTFGAGFPAKVEITRGGTGATTAADARTNLDVPSKADLTSEINTRTSEVARLDQKIIDSIPPAATTSVRGTIILSSAIDSASEALAATPKAVKIVYDKATAIDTRLTSEVSTLEAADTATNQQLTSEVSRLEGEIAAHTPPDASLTTKGVVQLNSDVNSTSEALAATPKAVKTAYDKAVAAATKSASADKLTTARSIELTGPVTGTVDFDGSANVSIPTSVTSATTSVKGIVKLSSATNSTSEAVAATSKAVKAAYDKAVEAYTQATEAIEIDSSGYSSSQHWVRYKDGRQIIYSDWMESIGGTVTFVKPFTTNPAMIGFDNANVPANTERRAKFTAITGTYFTTQDWAYGSPNKSGCWLAMGTWE